LKLWFYRHFRYTTYLTIHDQLREKWRREEQNRRFRTMSGRDSALAQFLLEEKAGHCEYFATATTLLLRAAGEKARYVVGFSVQEKHPKTGEYLLRGTHAHAWCRVWNEQTGRWINVDTTPPTWVGESSLGDERIRGAGWWCVIVDCLAAMADACASWGG
jgi:maltooligosyltrehalose synthase